MVVEPVYRIAAFPADVARATRTAVVSQDTLAKENRELRDALLLAQARAEPADALVAQNARLKDLLDAQNSLGLSRAARAARSMSISIRSGRASCSTSASNQGVTVGQPVIDAHGVMGQIVEVLRATRRSRC